MMAQEDQNQGEKKRDFNSGSSSHDMNHGSPENVVITGILDERIRNLREAMKEIDDALDGRHELNRQFLIQIDREAEEVKRYLNTLQPPWKLGFYPEIEFLRLSLHKSLTSRAHDRRTEELKYWENGVNLGKERRKFYDEYQALLAARRRLPGP